MVWHARVDPCLDAADHGGRTVIAIFAARQKRAPSGVKRAERRGVSAAPNALTITPSITTELSTAIRWPSHRTHPETTRTGSWVCRAVYPTYLGGIDVSYEMKCTVCQTDCHWVASPSGGWWAHAVYPADCHDARTGFDPREVKNENGNWVTK